MEKRQRIIYLYFIILPFIDLITSLITRFTDVPLSLGMIVKGVTLIISVIYIFIFSKSKYKKISIGYLIGMVVFGLLYLGTKSDIWNVSAILNEAIYAFRYLYFPVMVCGVFNIFDDLKIDNEFIKKILLINCITYVFLLLIPYVTGTGFNSYRYSSMHGENGWFYAANETGTIMVVLLSSISYFLNPIKKYKVILVLPIIFAVSLIGTKVSYLGVILVVIMTYIKYSVEHNNVKNVVNRFIIPSGMLILFLVLISSFSPTLTNFEGAIDRVTNQENKEELTEELDKEEKKYKYEKVEDLIPNKDVAKVFTLALNGRADFFLKNYSVYYNSSFVDKLFGLSWSNREKLDYTFEKKLIEIDYLDIFIHYGILGFIVYFLPLLYFVIQVIKKIKFLDLDGWFYVLLLILVLGISSLSGHVLAAPAVSIYLVLVMYIISNHLVEKKKLKENEITILALHLGFGGIEKYISSLCRMLKDNYKIKIITTYKVQEKPAFDFDDSIEITYLICDKPNKTEFKNAINERNLKNIIVEGFKCVRILWLKNSRNVDAIKRINSKYIITTRDFHSKLVGVYANRGITKIATEHNFHNNDNKYINKVVKSLFGFAYFVVVSSNLKEFYKDKIGNTKCIYIPNVIDELPNKESSLGDNNIINIGRLENEKGLFDLIDVLYEVKKVITDVKLFLIGDGTLKEELVKKVRDYDLEENVIFTGFLTKDKIEDYLLKSKLFVMTSYTESFGLVLIEAMSYKVGCIAFDSADGAKNLLKNDSGVLISNRNKSKMASEIINLLKNNKLLTKYSNNGYRRCQDFLSNNVKKQWLKILK